MTIDSAQSGSAGSKPIEDLGIVSKQNLSVSHEHLEISGFIFSNDGEFIGTSSGKEADHENLVLFIA